MPNPEWKDVTSYCNGDDREPQSWACDLAGERLCVTRLHGHEGWWRLGLFAATHKPLKSEDIEDAKREALALMAARIDAIAKALGIKEAA